MPARKASLGITNRYRSEFAKVNRAAAREVGIGFNRIVRVDNIDSNFQLFVPYAAGVINAARSRQVRLADGYASRFLTSELRRSFRPLGLSDNRYTEFDQFGRPLDEALKPAVYSLKLGLSAGYPVPTAVGFGVARVTRIAATTVSAAGRAALGDIIERRDEIRGWSRVAESDACGACLALMDGDTLEPTDTLSEHPNCNCTAEPVVDGVEQKYERPTGQEIFDAKSEEEQNALFDGRGGADKAQLIRDGMPLRDLVVEEPYALDGSQVLITEAPLAALGG